MAAKATRAEFDARLGEVGGSLAAFVVLRLADEAPGGLELSQGQLAERMGVEAPTMVRHLDRLEKEGLIERRRDIRDREASPSGEPGAGTIVTLTADGDLAQLAFLLGREVQGVALSRQVENTVVLHAMQARGLLPQLLNAAEGGGFGVRDVSVSEPTLENVFIHLTGKDLRD